MARGHKRKGCSGCKYHPSRTQGFQKFVRQRAYQKYLARKPRSTRVAPIDISRSGWSSRK